MSLLFSTVSGFVITFLPRIKCLLISWLQSPSTVILKPKKRKSVTTSTFSPSVCHEGNGTPLQYSCLEIPWMEEPGRLQSMGSRRVGYNWATSLSLFTFMHWRRKWQRNSSVLAWRIPGTGEPGGLPSMGLHRVRHDQSDLAAAAAKIMKVTTNKTFSV